MDNYMELSLARPLEFELVFLYLPMGMMFRLKKQKASALSPTAATFFTNLSEPCYEAKRWKP